MVEEQMTTTLAELPGWRVAHNLGVVWGNAIRSRPFLETTSNYEELYRTGRERAFQTMLAAASARGANAVLGVQFINYSISMGMAEIACFGTAVGVEKAPVALGQ